MRRRIGAIAIVAAAALATAGVAQAPASAHGRDGGYVQNNLVADQPGKAALTDPHLINPWGMSHGPTTPVWASNAGTSTATLYAGALDGRTDPTIAPLVVDIPGGPPTGQVFNDTTAFPLPGTTTTSHFIFAGLGGAITAWASGSSAAIAARSAGSIYTGLTLTHSPFGPLLLAADFHNGRIDVYDASFTKLAVDRLFADPRLPRGYAPFNVAEIGDRVFVSYAKQDRARQMDVPGRGHGFVDVFTDYGAFLKRFASGPDFNSPWGMTIAPSDFGKFADDLLIGNFGDGRIHAFDPRTGRQLGTLRDQHHRTIVIPGLWSLMVGDPAAGGTSAVWFSAGPQHGAHGLLGTLTAH